MRKLSVIMVAIILAVLGATAAYATDGENTEAVNATETVSQATETTEENEAPEFTLSEALIDETRTSSDGNFKLKVYDDGKTSYVDIIKYLGKDDLKKNYKISEIDGYKVRQIRSKAFKNLDSLKNVTFEGSSFGEKGRSKVKKRAFYNCDNMKSFTCNSLVKMNKESVGYSDGKKNETFTELNFDDNAATKYDVSNKISYAESEGVNAVYNVNTDNDKTKKAYLKEDVNGSVFNATLDGDSVEGWKSSNSDVISITSDGKATVLGKGKTTLSIKSGDTKIKRKFNVEEDPYLTKNGKAVTTVEVKNGQTVKVDINGKASSVDNVYANTSKAKVVSEASSKSLKIKGTKKGTTTLKITVNGKTIKLKVKVKKNPITNDDMLKIASMIGWQNQYNYSDSTVMCSAYSFAYAYKQVTGSTRSAGSFWSPGGCTWIGGTYSHYDSSASMLKALKSSIDKDQACVALLAYGSSSTHYVTVYDYTGKGDKLSDFKILDPWDGCLTTGSIFRYCGSGYHVITVDEA